MFVCSLTAYLRVYEHTVPGPKKLKRLGVELGTIYAKVSRNLSCETLFCHTTILTNRFYIVNKSAQTTNLLYTLRVESCYVVLVS